MKQLIGRKAKIISDNDNYDRFRNEILIVTHADNKGRGYDDSCYPEMLCDFKTESGKEFPFALYEYEFQLI
jgi:hypothetical protein